jgi:hypothetical protein
MERGGEREMRYYEILKCIAIIYQLKINKSSLKNKSSKHLKEKLVNAK